MKQINIFTTDAIPRSRYYKYYTGNIINSGNQPSKSGNNQTIIQNPALIRGNTYSDLESLPTNDRLSDVIYYVEDTNDLYTYDEDTDTFIPLGSTQSVVYSSGPPTGQGETNKYYIDTTNKNGYFWNGSAFVQMSSGGFTKTSNTQIVDGITTDPIRFLTTESALYNNGSDTVIFSEYYKTLLPGNNINFTQSSGQGTVTINSTGSGGGFTNTSNTQSSDTSTGTNGFNILTDATSLTNNTSTVILNEGMKRLVPGNNVSFSQSGNTIAINSNGGSGGSGLINTNNTVSTAPASTSSINFLHSNTSLTDNGTTATLNEYNGRILPGNNTSFRASGGDTYIDGTAGIVNINNQLGPTVNIQNSDGTIGVVAQSNAITLSVNEGNIVDGITNCINPSNSNKIETNRVPAAHYDYVTAGGGWSKQNLHLITGRIYVYTTLNDNESFSYNVANGLSVDLMTAFAPQCDFVQDYNPGNSDYVSPEFYHTSIDRDLNSQSIIFRLTNTFNGSKSYRGFLTFSLWTTLNTQNLFLQ